MNKVRVYVCNIVFNLCHYVHGVPSDCLDVGVGRNLFYILYNEGYFVPYLTTKSLTPAWQYTIAFNKAPLLLSPPMLLLRVYGNDPWSHRVFYTNLFGQNVSTKCKNGIRKSDFSKGKPREATWPSVLTSESTQVSNGLGWEHPFAKLSTTGPTGPKLSSAETICLCFLKWHRKIQ